MFTEYRSKRRTSEIKFVWIIENFLSWCDIRTKIESPVFRDRGVHQTKWQLHLYPKGLAGDSNNAKLELHKPTDESLGIDIKATYQITRNEQKEVDFVRDASISGFSSNFSFSSLKQNQTLYYPDGHLRIQCVVQVGDFISSHEESDEEIVDKKTSDTSVGLKHYLTNDSFSDVTFCVGESKFPSHKVVLSAASPVFASMFKTGTKESRTNRVDVVDVDPLVFHEMLRYIYSGEVNNLDIMATKLITTAEKYQLEKLKNICERELIDKLTVHNAATLLVLGDTYSADLLKNKTLCFISSRRDEVRQTKEWKKIIKSHPQIVAEVYDHLMGCSLRGKQ